MSDGMAPLSAWSMDFLRALYERPWWARAILRIVFGRYAYREFIGMIDTTNKYFTGIDIGYDLKGIDYNKERTPMSWWKRELKDSHYGDR